MKPKPCPICGKDPDVQDGYYSFCGYWVSCCQKSHSIAASECKTERGAIASWNRLVERIRGLK